MYASKPVAKLIPTILMFLLLIFPCLIFAQDKAEKKRFADCVVEQIKSSPGGKPIPEIEALCVEKVLEAQTEVEQVGLVGRKFIRERQAEANRHVITSHRQNYVLPFAHSNNLNPDVYDEIDGWADDFRHGEAIFQMSYKLRLTSVDLFNEYDGLYFGMTLKSWWQVYAKESSRQFRETNYEPELFYLTPIKANFYGANLGLMLGISHQSNGRSQLLSRSWNRVYLGLVYEREDFALNLRPWYRIQEDPKESPDNAEGDDNPNIEQYMGDFDLTAVKRFGNNNELSVLFRNNLREENRGAIEIGYSFPIPKSHLKGFIQYFNGYGESLIDYDHHQERIGIGVLLTDLL